MTAAGPVTRRASAPADEVTAVHGARWIATAAVLVGVLNYVYALALTRMLDVGSYAVFAAGQGLVVCTAAVAVVTVPWMLAQALARARSEEEQAEAVRFAVVTGLAGGLLAACAVGAVAAQFAAATTTLVIAGSTFLIYVTRVSAGWLQGTERLRTLGVVTTAEALLKLAVGLVLVAALDLGATGALAAFGIGVLPYVFCRPRRLRDGRGRPWLQATANRALWRRAVGVASLQGVVALMAAVDVILVAMLPTDRAEAASYQAAVMLGRVPLFLAGAVSIAFLPALSRRRSGTPLAGDALRMYLTVAVPLTAVAATAPGAVLSRVFPAGYAEVGGLLALTAVTGLALGALALLVTFCQAVNDYACLWPLVAGLLLYVTGLTAGWSANGVLGMAVGGMCGTLAALLVFGVRHARRHGFGAPGTLLGLFGARPLWLLGLVAGLMLLRPHPVAWFAAAVLVAVLALWWFFGRRSEPVGRAEPEAPPAATGDEKQAVRLVVGARWRDRPGPATPSARAAPEAPPAAAGDEERAVRLLVDAVWRDRPGPATDAELLGALAVARRNQVEGVLARAYPERLAATRAEVAAATGLFRRNLAESTARLRAAGIPAVLIKADLSGDYVYGNFDLVVPDGHWRRAQEALAGWYVRRERYWLERSTKVLLDPPSGPAAHLHTSVSWFGVPVVPTDRLFARAAPPNGDGRTDARTDGRADARTDGRGAAWLVPCPADRLRIWLAHALFQNLTLDLSELLALRALLTPEVVAEACREAGREGWAAGGGRALDTALDAMARLDRGEPVPLPVPLPVATSLRAGAEHSGHLLGQGRVRAAAREASLRVPLVVAKHVRRRES
ncbi:lipopolysaccharide biosynthesis protein [Streptomyces sp. NPDC053493]|uniref:lipopolysaccharide biosynthesis protein n=1 Tax=Streptomyces sp. NPDC053493 TaxID=3365705 RepID=UPI0037CE9199